MRFTYLQEYNDLNIKKCSKTLKWRNWIFCSYLLSVVDFWYSNKSYIRRSNSTWPVKDGFATVTYLETWNGEERQVEIIAALISIISSVGL